VLTNLLLHFPVKLTRFQIALAQLPRLRTLNILNWPDEDSTHHNLHGKTSNILYKALATDIFQTIHRYQKERVITQGLIFGEHKDCAFSEPSPYGRENDQRRYFQITAGRNWYLDFADTRQALHIEIDDLVLQLGLDVTDILDETFQSHSLAWTTGG